MSAAEPFFDTNVLLYLLSADTTKADRAESLLANGGTISVQVLNEFASVGLRKLAMSVTELREVLEPVRDVCRVEPVTEDTHDRALALSERYRFAFYDALLIAAALRAGCARLYSEDLQHGQLIDRQLRILNPFRQA
ncbi:MAG: PIN domain-containing protein [Steroidobacteraceae bacterium]|nr:PIN domain-containing protein [Steroidobacteraceae bacterium]